MTTKAKPRRALLAGATGLVGKHCLEQLLQTQRYDRVHVLVRRTVGMNHEKLEEHRVNFDALDEVNVGSVDDVYITLGTTIKAAGSQDAFYKVDHDYVVATAKLGKRAGATRIALVSSIGAGGAAGNFYLRVKTETERDVKALGYECVEILRPGLLVGDRQEKRPGEKFGIAAMKVISGAMVGPLRQYRPIQAADVANAMIKLLEKGESGEHVRTFAEMQDVLEKS
jgi:uncharacterized protein YbjT (DUF2867 family)